MSLDGFIATKDDDISWLSVADKDGEDYGYAEFTASIDTYVVGRKSYDKVISMIGNFPAADQFKCYVITRSNREPKGNISFYNGPIKELIESIRSEKGKHIYCDGGGEIVQLLLHEKLVDECMVFIIPTLLGDGKRLFESGIPRRNLRLVDSKSYDTGLVKVHYLII